MANSKSSAWDDYYFPIFQRLHKGTDFDLHEKVRQSYLKSKIKRTKNELEKFILEELKSYEK